MYYLFVDESGDDGGPQPADLFYNRQRRFFTIGGIIVNAENKTKFEQALDGIIAEHFRAVSLPLNFKLHYHELRKKDNPKFPYNTLTDSARYKICNTMFECIRNIDCYLISCSLDIAKHWSLYKSPANPRAYTLLLLMERFHLFLQDRGDKGEAYYEKYNKQLRKKVESVQHWLLTLDNFPKNIAFQNIKSVKSGDPAKERVLQFTDFFVYAHYSKSRSSGQASDRWYSIRHKYYHLDHPNPFKRGNFDV